MIEGHPRLGFAILGSVFVALLGVTVMIVSGAGRVRPEIPAGAVISSAALPATVTSVAARKQTTSRGAARGPIGVDPAWAERVGAKAGIPAAAMRAYADAELTADREQPGCHLSWNTLAGIGWIESQHGTIGDRVLGADGRSTPPVIGPALDGKQFAAIGATPESTAWHGDPTWDHAVGPLQFLSSTWDRWAADGDGDGVANPLDLDDAALAAAHYLCADGHDLAGAPGWNAAVLSYNHDQAYVVAVAAAANTYAQRSSG